MAPGRLKGLAAPLLAAALSAAFVWTLLDVGALSPDRLGRAVVNARDFMSNLVPPRTEGPLLVQLGWALVETVEIAYAGTLLGALLALPMSILAARSLFPGRFGHAVRVALAAVRTIPSLLWALLFVIMVGLGPFAGMLGIAFYSLGYLGKLFAEALEGVDPEILEAHRATGAGRLQVARHAAVPEAANALLSQLLFVFEYNVRASSILGLVGAGGIGFYLLRYLQLFEYERLASALLLLFAFVLLTETLGSWIRRRYLHEPARAAPL